MSSGYDERFFENKSIKMPALDPKATEYKNYKKLDYIHFSILFSITRKQPICTAVNIDGKYFSAITSKSKSNTWLHDETITPADQLDTSFYSITQEAFHKGHIVRRLDPCWGNEDTIKKAEADTFHFTNASPQHRNFNPAIWLELERNVLEKGAVAFDEKIVVFAGPVLSELDKPYIETVGGSLIFIPSRFWKIIVWKKKNGIHSAVGFMQSQESLIHRLVDQKYFLKERFRGDADEHFENMKFKNDAVYQVEISEIEKITGLLFDFTGIHLPKPKYVMDELTIGTAEVADKKYRGQYRSSGDEDINIEGMVLD